MCLYSLLYRQRNVVPQRIKTIGNTLQELLIQCSSIVTGSLLVTQSAGETFVIKTRHCGEIPEDIITVTADAKAYDEKKFEELGEKTVAGLAQPKSKSGEKKKLRERMETLLPRLMKASEVLGGSGQFWFVAIFCNDDNIKSMKYISAGQGLEKGKVFISSNTGTHVSEFQSSARLKALASQNSYIETPSKKKIVEAGTPKLIVAKKRRVNTDQENNGIASFENTDPVEDNSEEEEDESVILATPKKSATMSRPQPSRRKLELFVPKPNQLLPLAVMEYPTKGRGRGRGRPRKTVKASVTSGVGRGRGRGRPPGIGKSVGRGVKEAWDIESLSPVREGIIAAPMAPKNRATAKRGTLAAGSTVARGKAKAQNGGAAGATSVRNRAGGLRIKAAFMEEMRKAEEELDSSEDEANPTANEPSIRPTRANRRNLSNGAIIDLL